MKNVLLGAIAILTAMTVNAQDAKVKTGATKFSVALNGGIPVAANYTFAYGADLQVEIPATKGLSITGSAGYESFHWKVKSTSTTFTGNTALIPLLAGAKVPFNANWYGHGQLGYAVSANNASGLMGGGEGGFTYAGSFGWSNGKWDASVKYLATHPGGTDLGAIVARVAMVFGK